MGGSIAGETINATNFTIKAQPHISNIMLRSEL